MILLVSVSSDSVHRRLAADLASINRAATPWIIVIEHHPWSVTTDHLRQSRPPHTPDSTWQQADLACMAHSGDCAYTGTRLTATLLTTAAMSACGRPLSRCTTSTEWMSNSTVRRHARPALCPHTLHSTLDAMQQTGDLSQSRDQGRIMVPPVKRSTNMLAEHGCAANLSTLATVTWAPGSRRARACV